jgi:zinc protease
MFEGSRNAPGNAFDTWLTAAGGANNAWTNADETVYFMVFPSGALDLALFLESDRLAFLDAEISAGSVANQQDVVLQERDGGYAEPHGRDFDALVRLLFPAGHPYHVSTIGTVADIRGFTPDATLAFWRRHYRPDNATLVVVGNVDAERALAQVRAWFDDVPRAGSPPPSRPSVAEAEAVPPRPAHGVIEDTVEDRTLHVAWRTVPRAHPDTPALEVLAEVLSAGRGTRLDDALDWEGHLALGTWAFTWPSDIDGALAVGAYSERTPLRKLLAGIERVLADVIARPPDDAELERARTALTGAELDRTETPEDRAGLRLACIDHTGDPDCLDARIAAWRAVTSEDVARVARTWLVPERRVTLSVVPRGDRGALPGAQPVELP